MKFTALRLAVLATLSVASASSMAQSAARVSNQAYGYYYADTQVELDLNGTPTQFNNQEYYLNLYQNTQSSSASSLPLAASFFQSAAGNSLYNLPTVSLQGMASTTWGANHAIMSISGFDPVVTPNVSTTCPTTQGSGICSGPEIVTTFTTTPYAYGTSSSRWEEIYQTSGASGSLNTTYHITGTLGSQPSTSGTASGQAEFYWAQRDFNNTTLAYVSASYYASTDEWTKSTYSNITGLYDTTSGTGALTINESIDVARSFVTGDAVYVDSYLQASAWGNGIADLSNTVTLTKLDLPTGTRMYAASGASYGSVLSFEGGSGSGTVCTDIACLAGPGGGGGGVTPVPEAETWAMLLAGLGMMSLMIRQRKSRKA